MTDSALADPLAQRAFPELAAALESRIEPIVYRWSEEIREAIPLLKDVPFNEVIDHVPMILALMATVLRGEDEAGRQRFRDVSPAQGMSRFHLRYNVRELMLEDRMLRRRIITDTTEALGRDATMDEQVALNEVIDVMLQQAVIAFADEQQSRLRAVSERELKHLSFLSHDLRNNLNSVTLQLQLLRQRLAAFPEHAEDVEALDAAQQATLDTIGGMGQLLQAERLKQNSSEIQCKPVNLHRLASGFCHRLTPQARKKRIQLICEIPPELTVRSDHELITLVLQNLLGNAIKYGGGGSVRVTGEIGEGGECAISVIDQGPGIGQEHLERLFEAFRRGETYGQEGVGLGLSIASRAARLLNGTLKVESILGVGSTFTLRLPQEE